MGAPKQKWTAEEEAALKAGVRKHGMGKWRTILMDHEFSGTLRMRSNVDLKDKWRNINVTAIWGSRQKAKLALKRSPQTPKRDDDSKALSTVIQSNEESLDAKPLAISMGTHKTGGFKELLARLENLIFEAIATFKEPSGSDKASIALYIEVKHRYRIAPSAIASEGRRNGGVEGKQKGYLKSEKKRVKLTKSQVEQELSKIRGMTAMEAAAAAAKAVAEAEAAIAEAEEAAREAEIAEAEAEAAQVFAKAAMKAFKYRGYPA